MADTATESEWYYSDARCELDIRSCCPRRRRDDFCRSAEEHQSGGVIYYVVHLLWVLLYGFELFGAENTLLDTGWAFDILEVGSA